jgi:hypothetical protein
MIVKCENGHKAKFLVDCEIDNEIAQALAWSTLQTFAVCEDCYNKKPFFQRLAKRKELINDL